MKAVRLIGFHSQGIFNPADKRRETDGSDDVVFDPTLDIAQHPLSRWLPNEQDLAMKMIFKSTLAAALLAGAATVVPTFATAGVDVSVSIGAPAVVYAPGYSPYEGELYYDPIYFDGAWYHGPYRWRMVHGVRVFWVNGGWHGNEWRGRPIPASLVFRNGGYWRGGRYEGFRGADRINVRFAPGRSVARAEHAEMRSDREMRRDHR